MLYTHYIGKQLNDFVVENQQYMKTEIKISMKDRENQKCEKFSNSI